MRIKRSYGLICCKKINNHVEMIMIKKSVTYHYCEFVLGKYHNPKKDASKKHLKLLFNNMTHSEKTDILTLNFSTMWYRIYVENPEKIITLKNADCKKWITAYLRKKSKFESTFLRDGGRLLRELIKDSVNAELPWEYPKGHAELGEVPLETAIREFGEETGIINGYKILMRIKPYIQTYTDFSITYQNIYYFAHVPDNANVTPKYKFFNKTQVNEVADIKWVSKIKLQNMNLYERTLKRMCKMFNIVKKKYLNGIKKTILNKQLNINIKDEHAVKSSCKHRRNTDRRARDCNTD